MPGCALREICPFTQNYETRAVLESEDRLCCVALYDSRVVVKRSPFSVERLKAHLGRASDSRVCKFLTIGNRAAIRWPVGPKSSWHQADLDQDWVPWKQNTPSPSPKSHPTPARSRSGFTRRSGPPRPGDHHRHGDCSDLNEAGTIWTFKAPCLGGSPRTNGTCHTSYDSAATIYEVSWCPLLPDTPSPFYHPTRLHRESPSRWRLPQAPTPACPPNLNLRTSFSSATTCKSRTTSVRAMIDNELNTPIQHFFQGECDATPHRPFSY